MKGRGARAALPEMTARRVLRRGAARQQQRRGRAVAHAYKTRAAARRGRAASHDCQTRDCGAHAHAGARATILRGKSNAERRRPRRRGSATGAASRDARSRRGLEAVRSDRRACSQDAAAIDARSHDAAAMRARTAGCWRPPHMRACSPSLLAAPRCLAAPSACGDDSSVRSPRRKLLPPPEPHTAWTAARRGARRRALRGDESSTADARRAATRVSGRRADDASPR